jgi:hypothetical protein
VLVIVLQDYLLIMRADNVSRPLRQLRTIPIDDLRCLEGKVPFDLLHHLVCHVLILLLDSRPIPDPLPRDEAPEHHVIHPKGIANLAHVDCIGLLVQEVEHVHEGLPKRHHPKVRHMPFIPPAQIAVLVVGEV